ncbi:MAG: hypothetical protein LBS32_07700 [Clostridiales Family XIII bacterium]|nr:hypothetical protein [Clostridiales Family XIII bacterium]
MENRTVSFRDWALERGMTVSPRRLRRLIDARRMLAGTYRRLGADGPAGRVEAGTGALEAMLADAAGTAAALRAAEAASGGLERDLLAGMLFDWELEAGGDPRMALNFREPPPVRLPRRGDAGAAVWTGAQGRTDGGDEGAR